MRSEGVVVNALRQRFEGLMRRSDDIGEEALANSTPSRPKIARSKSSVSLIS